MLLGTGPKNAQYASDEGTPAESGSRREAQTMRTTVFTDARRDRMKRAFTTRRVATTDMKTLVSGPIRPRAGDLVLATVSEIGKQTKIELPSGRRASMMPGDEILVVYGNRYAPDQFEALVSLDLGPCDLVAAGGVAGREICRHDRMPSPTAIEPIGLVADAEGARLNLSQYAIKVGDRAKPIQVVLVAGTAMNSGKTFTAASLIHGFARNGFSVAGIKSTGTGSGGDLWTMKDHGADFTADFTDAGMASTYLAPHDQIVDGILGLVAAAGEAGCEIAVVEIADGLHHRETAKLLAEPRLRNLASGIVFAAYDSMGAASGAKALTELGHKIFAISGRLMRSPLAVRETMGAVTCPVVNPMAIRAGALVEPITGRVVDVAANLAAQPFYGHRPGETGDRAARLSADRAIIARRLVWDEANPFAYPLDGEAAGEA